MRVSLSTGGIDGEAAGVRVRIGGGGQDLGVRTWGRVCQQPQEKGADVRWRDGEAAGDGCQGAAAPENIGREGGLLRAVFEAVLEAALGGGRALGASERY